MAQVGLTGWSTISCLRHHRQTSVIIGECSRLYHHILVNILESLDVYLYLRAFLKQIHSSHIHYLALVARVIALFKPILPAAPSFHDNSYSKASKRDGPIVFYSAEASSLPLPHHSTHQSHVTPTIHKKPTKPLLTQTRE